MQVRSAWQAAPILVTSLAAAALAQDGGTKEEQRAVVHSTGRVAVPFAAPAGRVTGKPFLGSATGGSVPRDQRFVHGTDDRFLVPATDAWPYRTVCKVIAEVGGGLVVTGTGVLVGPRHVLTAGHVVYEKRTGGWSNDVLVIPAHDDGDEPFGHAFATNLRSWAGWTESEDPRWDMALIELDAPVGETTGYLGLWAAPNEALRPAILESAGYPGDKRKQLGADHMWGVLGEVRRVTAHEIYLGNRFDTWNGQSGSGLWIDESEQGGGIFVVGVFAYGSPRSYNSGTRLNRFRYAYVTAWIDGYEAPADVTVESVASTLPARAEVLSQGSVDVRVANLGGSPAAFPVTLRLERRAADPLLLGATIVDLAAGASTVASFPVSIPEGLGDRAARFVAQLNEDLDVAESDETNNVGSSAGFQILPAPTALVAGPWTSRRIVAGELVRYEVPVPDGMRRLRFELRGARCRATALDPLGAEVSFRTGRTLSPPIAGTWTLLVENQSRRARRVTVRARVR